MKTIVLSALFTIFLFVSGATGASACSCIAASGDEKFLEKQIKTAYKQSAAVFSGKVGEIIREPNAFFVKIKIHPNKIYKGKFTKEVIISTGQGGGDCGYTFEVGKSYLIYAYGDSGNLKTNICQRTSLIEETKDIKILNKIRKKKN